MPISQIQKPNYELLGTLITTSGTTQTLGSLDLTNYQSLHIVIDGVSFTAGTLTLTLGGVAVAPITAGPTGASGTQSGLIDLDLLNGVFSWSATGNALSVNNEAGGGKTAYNNATTSIVFAGGTFDAGAIYVYGVNK